MACLHIGILLCLLLGLIVCDSGGSIVGSFQEEILARIQTLEKQGHKQAKTMQKMEKRLEEQDEKLVKQQITINEYQTRIKELENTMKELQQADQPLINRDFRKYKDDCRKRQPIPVNDAVKQRRVLLNAERPMAFHAVITKGEVPHIGADQNIVFPDVMINLGGGYHNLHGVFIAPTPGIYIFSTSIMAFNIAHVEIMVHLMKNGHVLANAYAHGDGGRCDQGSVTLVTQLAAGDEVWVSLYAPADTSLWGDYFDSFMGCLVYAM